MMKGRIELKINRHIIGARLDLLEKDKHYFLKQLKSMRRNLYIASLYEDQVAVITVEIDSRDNEELLELEALRHVPS